MLRADTRAHTVLRSCLRAGVPPRIVGIMSHRLLAPIRGGLLAALLPVMACTPAPSTSSPPPAAPPGIAGARQLVVVTTSAWDSITGELRRYARRELDGAWQAVGGPVPIVVGRTGLAWGVGLEEAAAWAATGGTVKREGDGRAPAGYFPLREAFGFAPADSAGWLRQTYRQLTGETECVDDTASMHYNTIVERGRVGRVDWRSSERMRSIEPYRLGVLVGYNEAPVAKARGSCIFLHIWGGPRTPTAGCTAMDAVELERLMAWLDPAARPVLVQLPAAAYGRLQGRWALPPR